MAMGPLCMCVRCVCACVCACVCVGRGVGVRGGVIPMLRCMGTPPCFLPFLETTFYDLGFAYLDDKPL